MDLDSLFGDSNNSKDLDTIDADAEVQDVEETEELEATDEIDEAEVDEAPEEHGIGWKILVLFICGGLVITALALAFMVWVIEALVL
ncbi:hypothetical protein ABZ345_38670 [Lentzea sp. NPDC005914]|uniref:hypothetical protein n=1 Tax=Lentzea sp. NPDC005914 TaxID=3154572 RepID=UPI0033EACF69